MATKHFARLAAVAATIGIAGLPLAVATPADAINKPEPGGVAGPPAPPADDTNFDLAQIGAGTLGGIAVSVAGFAAATRLRRRNQPTSNV
jgi:hypothetical protein